jgi:hypothetical protein
MDTNVKVLMDATGCTETEAQSVLESAGGDVTKAMKMLDAVSKEIMVFQIRYRPVAKDSAGVGYMVAMFNTATSSVVYTDIVYPLGSGKESALDINMPPTVFVSTLRATRNQLGDRHKASSESNASLIKNRFTASFIQSVVASHNAGQTESVAQRFAQAIGGVTGENVKVSYFARAHSLDSLGGVIGAAKPTITPEQQAAQLFGSDEHTAPAQAAETVEDLPNASPQEPLPRIALICEPEVSPFTGKPAGSIAEGDQIVVKIKDGRESARYFAELLGGAIGGELIPLCVPVIKKNAMSDTFVEIFVEFGPGIYGQLFVPPGVKVKTRDEDVELYNPFQDEESLYADKRFGRKIIVGLGALIAFIIALIVVIVAI